MDRPRSTISARRSGGCWCGEMGWKIRTRGRIRSPCRNEPGGNWGIDRACQDLTVPGSCGERLATYHCKKIYNYTQGCTAPVICYVRGREKPTTGGRVGLAPETGRLGSQQQQATDDVTGLEGLWGPFPDIWCSFGRGMKWLWRSRRIDRQSLFCAYFLQRSAIVSLTHSHTSLARALTHSRDCWGCSAGAGADAGADASWLVGHPPSAHPSTRPRVTQPFPFFFLPCNVLGVQSGQWSTGQPSTWVHTGNNSVLYLGLGSEVRTLTQYLVHTVVEGGGGLRGSQPICPIPVLWKWNGLTSY